MKKLPPFAYYEPDTLAEAIQILAREGERTMPLAGGTDVLVRMKKGEIHPAALVSIKGIPGLQQIETRSGNGLSIGALVSISAIEYSETVQREYPLLARAAEVLGAPSIRNLATIGGNIGRASPASDMAPALMVLGARVAIEGSGGTREIPIEELFRGPHQTNLYPGEIITAFRLPPLPPRCGAAYVRMGRRQGMDLALTGAAAFLALSENGEDVLEGRLGLASVAPTPLRARKAEEILCSGPIQENRILEAAEAAAMESSPIGDMRASQSYRREMVKVLAARCLRMALKIARERIRG